MHAQSTLLAAIALALTACAANQQWVGATPEQRRVMFENGWNSSIGQRYVPYESTILSVTGTKDGQREYIIKQLNDCQIELVIDDASSVLRSWRYVSEPAKCWAYYYSPGA